MRECVQKFNADFVRFLLHRIRRIFANMHFLQEDDRKYDLDPVRTIYSATILKDNGSLKRQRCIEHSVGYAPLPKPTVLEEQTKVTIVSSVPVPTVAGADGKIAMKKARITNTRLEALKSYLESERP